jgi:hypothetical protein
MDKIILTDEEKIIIDFARKERIKQWRKQYYINNKEKYNQYSQKYKEQRTKTSKQYYINNKENLIQNIKQRNKQPSYKIKNSIRKSFNTQGIKRPDHLTWEILLGCTVEFAINHLQQSAINKGYVGFDMNNYSGKDYNIDHKVPKITFDLSIDEQAMQCCHYSNLQILTKKENYAKVISDNLIYKTKENI